MKEIDKTAQFKDKTEPVAYEPVSLDYEAECERMSMIIMRQHETIHALKTALYNMSIVMMQEDTKVTR